MARSFARLYVRAWADPEFRALPVDPQHLYMVLISQDNMNLAGVLPLQLRRWSGCVADWDPERVQAALDRLTADRFTVVDEDTEEVLVRSLVRNDEAYKTPGMLKSILKFAEGTQAPSLRRELAIELGRLDRLEGKKAEEGMALIAATRLALMPEGTPPDGGVIHRSEPIADGIGDGIADTFLGTHRRYLPNHAKEPITDTSVSVSVSVPSLSLVRSLGGKGAPPPPDEPPLCAKHEGMDRDEVPPCRACGRLRENWELTRTEAAKPKPLPPLCGECDNRWIEMPDGSAAHCPRCHPQAAAS
jgi:hypothetical protein